MANTHRYTLDDYVKLPTWLQRSWNIFERVNIRADYQSDIAETREKVTNGTANIANEVIRIERDYRLGQGMDKVIIEQISNPNANNDTLLNMMLPRMRFINYGQGMILPSQDPQEEFTANERLRRLIQERRGVDIAQSSEVMYLAMPIGTTKEEARSFIDEYFDEAREEFVGEVYFESDKETKQRIRRVSVDEIIDERIHELYGQGVRPRNIPPILYTEFNRTFEPFEIRKRHNQMLRRKRRQ